MRLACSRKGTACGRTSGGGWLVGGTDGDPVDTSSGFPSAEEHRILHARRTTLRRIRGACMHGCAVQYQGSRPCRFHPFSTAPPLACATISTDASGPSNPRDPPPLPSPPSVRPGHPHTPIDTFPLLSIRFPSPSVFSSGPRTCQASCRSLAPFRTTPSSNAVPMAAYVCSLAHVGACRRRTSTSKDAKKAPGRALGLAGGAEGPLEPKQEPYAVSSSASRKMRSPPSGNAVIKVRGMRPHASKKTREEGNPRLKPRLESSGREEKNLS